MRDERVCKNCGNSVYFCESCEAWHHTVSNWQCVRAELLTEPPLNKTNEMKP